MTSSEGTHSRVTKESTKNNVDIKYQNTEGTNDGALSHGSNVDKKSSQQVADKLMSFGFKKIGTELGTSAFLERTSHFDNQFDHMHAQQFDKSQIKEIRKP